MIPIEKKKLLLLVIGLFILLIVIVSAIYLFFNHPSTTTYNDPSAINSYIDPGSGEILYNPPGEMPEGSGNNITLFGFSKLLDIGITSNQLTSLKSYFSDYSSIQKTPIKEFSIAWSSIKQAINKVTGEKKLTFIVTVDRKSSLNAQAIYTGIDDMILNLYNSTNGARVYASNNSGN